MAPRNASPAASPPTTAVVAHFRHNFNPNTNTVKIGTCSCGDDIYAHLRDHEHDITLRCRTGRTHTWAATSLAPDLASLGPTKNKKTTKKLLTLQLRSWEYYRELAPALEPEETVLVQYNADIEAAGAGAAGVGGEVEEGAGEGVEGAVGEETDRDGMQFDGGAVKAEDQGPGIEGVAESGAMPAEEGNGAETVVEEVPRPELESEDDDEDEDAQGATISAAGILIVNPREGSEEDLAHTLLHMARDLCTRFGPRVLEDTPILLAAWSTHDATIFLPVLLAIVPRYLPSSDPNSSRLRRFFRSVAGSGAVLHLQRALGHPIVTRSFRAILSGLHLADNDRRLIMPPTNIVRSILTRFALLDVQGQRNEAGC